MSAAKAEYFYKNEFISIEDPLNSDFAWIMIYNILNIDEYKNTDIKQKEDGSLIVSSSLMKNYFTSAFLIFQESCRKYQLNIRI